MCRNRRGSGLTFDRQHLGGRAYALVSTALERDGFLAAFTERAGGTSEGAFASLNISFRVHDDGSTVLANRTRVIEGLGIRPFAIAGIVHGTRLVRVGARRAGAGFDDRAHEIGGADGLFTTSVATPLAITTADCLPLVMGSGVERIVAIVHAGWRGIAGGIVSRAAALFDDPANVRVAIGPTVGRDHYEVGEDVARAIAAASPAGATTVRRRGRLFLDLVATTRAILREHGVREIEDTGMCTACERRRFFSHRRDGEPTGRQAAIAMRLSP